MVKPLSKCVRGQEFETHLHLFNRVITGIEMASTFVPNKKEDQQRVQAA